MSYVLHRFVRCWRHYIRWAWSGPTRTSRYCLLGTLHPPLKVGGAVGGGWVGGVVRGVGEIGVGAVVKSCAVLSQDEAAAAALCCGTT